MAGSAVVGILRVLLTADAAQYETTMKRASSSALEWSKSFNSIGRQASDVGQAFTKLTLPLAALAVGSAKVAIDFESSFAGVRKTVKATEPEFERLSQGLRDMAKEVPVNVNELNKVAEAAGQLGIKKDDILGFTRTMADLGATTNLTAEEAATATAQFQNIFGAAGKDVDRFGATLVALGNDGASTEKQILDMGLRIAGAGQQVGLQQHQVLAFANALSSVGINAEAGGSAISRTFLKINDAVMDGGAAMREFARVAGMSGEDFKTAWGKDAAAATAAFITGLQRIKGEGENVNKTLEGLVGKNIIIKDTLMRAAGAGDYLSNSLRTGAVSWQENSALATEAHERYKTFASQLTVFASKVRDVGISLGQAMMPAMQSALSIASSLVPVVEMMVKAFTALPTWVQAGALAMGAIFVAAGPALWAFGEILQAAAAIVGAFKAKGIATRAMTAAMESAKVVTGALGAALRGLAGAFLPLAAAITAVWAAWKIGNTETVKNRIAEWGLSSENLTARLYRLITGLDKMTPEQARAAVAATAAAEAARGQAAALDDASDAASQFVGPMQQVGKAADAGSAKLDDADKSAKAFAESLRALGGADAIAGAKEVVRQLHALDGPLNVLPGKLEEMASRLREGAQAALLMGKADLANGYSKLADTLNPIIQFQQRYNVTIGEYVTNAPKAAFLTQEMSDQLHELGGTAQTILPELQSVFDVSKWFTPLKGSIKQNMPDRSAWADAWSSMKDGLAVTLSNIPQTLANAFTGGGDIGGAIKSIASQIGSALGGSIGSMLGPWGQQFGAALGSMAGMLGGPLKKLFGIGVNEAIQQANAKIFDAKAALMQMHGPLDVLEAKARAVGLSFMEAWGHQGTKGLGMFQELVKEFNARWDELQAKRAGLESALATQIESVDSLRGKARELGYDFDESGKFIGVTFDAAKSKADEFGVSVDGLGPKFRQQGIDAEAGKIINAFTLMSQAGGDTGGILVGMKDEIGKLVSDSIKLGTTIPKNMEPWIKNLMETDQLVDENKQKIDDLSKLKFGDPIATEFETIAQQIQDGVKQVSDLKALIDAIPTDKTITFRAQYVDDGPPSGWGGSRDSVRPREGGSSPDADPGNSVGTLGRHGKWFHNFGAGTDTSLHGVEAVITASQALPFARDVMGESFNGRAVSEAFGSILGDIGAAMSISQTPLLEMDLSSVAGAVGGGGGGGGQGLDFSALQFEVQGLREELTRQNRSLPTHIASAVRAAMQLGMRRR